MGSDSLASIFRGEVLFAMCVLMRHEGTRLARTGGSPTKQSGVEGNIIPPWMGLLGL